MSDPFAMKRKDVPEPDHMVTWTVQGNDRAASRIMPHVAHYSESWHYDVPTGDLISYSRYYGHYKNPEYADREFPEGIPLQRWDRKKCTCDLCKGRAQ